MDKSVFLHLAEHTPEQRGFKSSIFKKRYEDAEISRNASMIANTSATTPKSVFLDSTMNSSQKNQSLMFIEGSTTIPNFSSIFEAPLLDITEDTTTFAFLNGDSDPNEKASTLFQEFLEFYQSYTGEHEIFDLLLQYEETCSSTAKQLVNMLKKTAPSQQKHKSGTVVLKSLQLERNTWRLLRTLYQDRVLIDSMTEDRYFADCAGERLSDKQIIHNLFSRSSVVRQAQLVVDWLEKNADEDFSDTYLDKLEYFVDHSTSWEQTLHDLTSGKSFSPRGVFVTELDPDAPFRQQHHGLCAADKENETRLLKLMFMVVRTGNLDKAQQMAEDFGQPWLAASLEGWRLYHDPNYENESLVEGSNLLPIEGNKYRDIWKASCWRMADESRIPMYLQALYGLLSGNLKAILRGCVNWYDYLWAYARVFIDKQTEEELRTNTQCGRSLEELPPEYWDKMLNFDMIFQELSACSSEEVKKDGQNHHQLIQKCIILDDIDGLIEMMYSWSQQEPCLSPHLLRVMCHIVLFLRSINRCSKEELCVAIVEAYVKALIEQQKTALIAFYAATLPPMHQVMWYAKFLEGVTDSSQRQLCLKYAEEAGLDLTSITKMVVENIRTKMPSDNEEVGVATHSEMSEDDEQKIHALDWLVFDQLQRAEAMKQANALMRIFVASQKLSAAKLTFEKIPSDSINIMMKCAKQIGQMELRAEDDNAIREYLCFKAYIEAFNSFNDWFQHFQHSKPKCPEPPAGVNMKFKEKVAYEHEKKQYELEHERWRNALMAQTKTTTDRLYNVLLFVNGGWMVDQRKDGLKDDNRQMQMALLRKLCIPQITKLLHKVLFSTELYKESVQLADIIASERHQLYKEFDSQELQQFLSSICESSLVLLEQNADPLGYVFRPQNGHMMDL